MRILIQCGDHLENQNRIALLARILYKNGINPIILMYDPSKGSYLKQEGFSVVYLNDYLRIDKLLKENKTEIDAKLLLEAEARRNPKLAWPSKYKNNLEKSERYLIAIDLILRKYNPEHICIWNGFTGFVANALRLLSDTKKIKTSFLERGIFKDSIFIDRIGVNGASSLSGINSGNWRRREYSNDLLFYCENVFHKSGDEIKEIKKEKIIFFPLQVQLDTNIIYYSPYKTMREAFIKIHEKMNAPDTVFVVRPHPEEVEGAMLNFPLYDNVIISSEKPLDYWINAADIVVTINSTVGLEALIAGKKVITLGRSIYSELNCVSKLSDNTNRETDSEELREYLCFLLEHNLIKKDSNFSENVAILNLGFKPAKYKIFSVYEKIKSHFNNLFSGKKNLKIGLAFPVGSRIDLTYRKNNILVDAKHVKDICYETFGIKDVELFSAFGTNHQKLDVLMVGDYWDKKEKSSDVVIDYYGAVKYVKGMGYL